MAWVAGLGIDEAHRDVELRRVLVAESPQRHHGVHPVDRRFILRPARLRRLLGRGNGRVVADGAERARDRLREDLQRGQGRPLHTTVGRLQTLSAYMNFEAGYQVRTVRVKTFGRFWHH